MNEPIDRKLKTNPTPVAPGENLDRDEDDIETTPEERYRSLRRSISRTKGFGLKFVQCSPAEGTRIINRLEGDLPGKNIEVLDLKEAIDNLYEIVAALPNRDKIDVLCISGIERSLVDYIRPGYGGEGDYYKLDSVPKILGHLNQQRERFRDDFPICFVFLLPRFALKYFRRRSMDFFDWGTGAIEFPSDPSWVEQESERILLEGNYDEYLKWTPEQHRERIIELETMLSEPCQTIERQYYCLFQIGNILTASGKHTSSLEIWNKLVDFKVKDTRIWNDRGAVLDQLGRYEEAVTSYDKAIEIDPNDDIAWYNRGNALYGLWLFEEAVTSYDKAIEINPSNESAWHNRGVALKELEQYEEAIASYDKAIEANAELFLSWYSRGHVLHILGRYEEAIDNYTEALAINPKYYGAWHNRGADLQNLGRYEEAIDNYTEALAINSHNESAWFNRACSYAAQNDLEATLSDLKKAIQLNPECREYAKTDSAFDRLRDDPRFQALLEPET